MLEYSLSGDKKNKTTNLSTYNRSGGDSSSCSDLCQGRNCLLPAKAQGSATHSGLHTVEMVSQRLDYGLIT